MKKYLLSFILVATIIVAIILVSTNVKTKKTSSDKKHIVVSNFASYDFVRAVLGDTKDVEVNFIVGAGKDIHSYEPTTQDIIEITQADMFIYIGGELEVWTDKVVDTLKDKNQKIIKISDSVELKEHKHHEEEHKHHEEGHEHHEEEHEHHEEEHKHHEEEHHHEEGAFDAHIWTSPANAILMLKEIEKQICEIDSKNIEAYKENTNNYADKISKVDEKIKTIVNDSNRKKLVFGDKMPLQYFLDYYNLDAEAAFSGCSTETEPSAKTITKLVNTVKNENIPVVIYTELNDGKVANIITNGAGNGSQAMQMQTFHNLTNDNFKSGETYVSLMEKNISVLEKALK